MGKHRAPDIIAAGDGPGTVYLIHFETPYKHARHYTGWASDLDRRIARHRAGDGARLMEVVTEAGIGWHVARTWEGTRDLERAIKDRHEAPRLCPDCSPHPLPGPVGLEARSAEAPASALESQLARDQGLQPAPELVPEPGAWAARPAGPEVYQELDEVTASLIEGWQAEPAAPEVGPPDSTAQPEAEPAAPEVGPPDSTAQPEAEPEAELELC